MIHTRLKVSKTYGVKLLMFCKRSITTYNAYNWTIWKNENTFYLVRTIIRENKRTLQLFHREFLGLVLGDKNIPDHQYGNGLNNHSDNLRLVTHQQNGMNAQRSSKNTSGFKGVSWNKALNKWRAYIGYNGKHIHLGYFDTKEEAHEAYCAKAIELFGDFANFG